MRTSKLILFGVIFFILIITTIYTIIFCIYGSYPTEIYLALVPVSMTELIALCKLELDKRKHERELQSQNEKNQTNG